MPRPDLEYVLPLRWRDDAGLADLTAYLAEASRTIDVTVVDGSEPALFRRHHRAWAELVRHSRPKPGQGATARSATS